MVELNMTTKPGEKFVVAVSGGIDSVCLLNLTVNLPDVSLVVAHFDHGIRPDSAADARFVQGLAEQYQLPFCTERVELGPEASEATARSARYGWLRDVTNKEKATAIVTAHHQDDLLETIVHNLTRGTGFRGLASLRSTRQLQRPLLGITKAELYDYAVTNHLEWIEDESNRDQRYTRNRIRSSIMPRLKRNPETLKQLLKCHRQVADDLVEIDQLTNELVGLVGPEQLNRQHFRVLPLSVSLELSRYYLKAAGGYVERHHIERFDEKVRSAHGNTVHDFGNGVRLKVERESAYFI